VVDVVVAVNVDALVDYIIIKVLEVVPSMPLIVITSTIIKILSTENDFPRHNYE
jgi:hypothetical protein